MIGIHSPNLLTTVYGEKRAPPKKQLISMVLQFLRRDGKSLKESARKSPAPPLVDHQRPIGTQARDPYFGLCSEHKVQDCR